MLPVLLSTMTRILFAPLPCVKTEVPGELGVLTVLPWGAVSRTRAHYRRCLSIIGVPESDWIPLDGFSVSVGMVADGEKTASF